METPQNLRSWFDGSKVADANGKPLSVFHASAIGHKDVQPPWFMSELTHAVERAFDASTAPWEVQMSEALLLIKKPIVVTNEVLFTCEEQAPTLYEIFTGRRLGGGDALDAINDEIGLGEAADLPDVVCADFAIEIMRRDGYDGLVHDFQQGRMTYVPFSSQQICVIRTWHMPRPADAGDR